MISTLHFHKNLLIIKSKKQVVASNPYLKYNFSILRDLMRKIKALIVDDEPAIRELILFYLMEEFSVESTEASNAKNAIEIMEKSKNSFDICICDYNMRGGNGDLLYKYIREHYPKLFFILTTSADWLDLKEFHSEYSACAEKPFQSGDLNKTVKFLLQEKEIISSLSEDYIGVSLEMLSKLSSISYPLFLKISDTNYIKISHQGTIIDQNFYSHYKNKKVDTLYFLKNDYSSLIKGFAESINLKEFFKLDDNVEKSKIKLASSILLVMDEAILNFGWSKEVEELARKNITLILSIIESKKNLKQIMSRVDFSSANFQILHSILISIISTALMKEVKVSEETSRLMSLAAFFHDVTLTPFLAENEHKFNQSLSSHRPTYKEEVEAIQKHPQQAIDQLSNGHFCPELVKTIILQHHERIDGAGYPHHLKATQLNEYAAAFILAEELSVLYIDHKNNNYIKEKWAKKSYYKIPPFAQFYQIIQSWLDQE
jgi:response regulator RpfG family c-di-GMP phosphodiesterase